MQSKKFYFVKRGNRSGISDKYLLVNHFSPSTSYHLFGKMAISLLLCRVVILKRKY